MASPRPCHVPFCKGKQQSRDAELDFAMHCKCIEKVLYSIVLIALTHFLNNDYWILTWQCIRIYLTLGIVYDTQTRHQTPRDIVPVLFYLFVCIYYCWFNLFLFWCFGNDFDCIYAQYCFCCVFTGNEFLETLAVGFIFFIFYIYRV